MGTVANIARSSPMEPLETRTCRTFEVWDCLLVCLSVVAGLTLMSPAVQARTLGKCSSPMTVAPGDTLSSIARRCGKTVPALIDANPHLSDPNILPVGFKLTLTQDPQNDRASRSESAENTHVIAIEPSILIPGGRVTVTASNMPPGARVWIKGGSSRSPKHHLILRGARVDSRGELDARVRLPRSLKAVHGDFNLSVEVPRAGMTLRSDPLEVDARYATGEVR
jgi:LysM repeat protein